MVKAVAQQQASRLSDQGRIDRGAFMALSIACINFTQAVTSAAQALQAAARSGMPPIPLSPEGRPPGDVRRA